MHWHDIHKKAVLIVIASLAFVCVGCSAPDEKQPPKKEVVAQPQRQHIIFTEAAKTELKQQSNKKWLISYNGTCSGAPALGFFPGDGKEVADGLRVEMEGATIILEKNVANLLEEWGCITLDCIDYNGDAAGGKQFVPEFKPKQEYSPPPRGGG